MNKDYQVLRFDNQIKPKEIGGLGVELEQRKGSGNYDKERTKFNIEYVGLYDNPTLSSKVYQTIYSRNIHFNKGANTNILNGCVITSGPDFFRKLGLKMVATDRVYADGNHKGEPIFCPNIKSQEDIPARVKEYFNESYNFIANIVGKDNIVYAAVHLDEDTPHMHIYFLPVVSEVKRKVFETDKNGKRITKQIYDKNNNIKNVPILKRDENGKILYEIKYGKFLDSDSFWKQLGGKSSFAKIQDEYNNFINSKGFNLDRGNIGSNRHHKEKAEYNINILEKKIEKLNTEIKNKQKINEIELKTNNDILNINDDILSPTKDILKRYKEKDLNKLIDYTKEIKKENIASKNALELKSIELEKLQNEIKDFKSGKTYSDKDKVIANQDKIIKEQNGIINNLKNDVAKLTEKLNTILKDFRKRINKAYRAIAHLIGFKGVNKDNIDDKLVEIYISNINSKYEKSTKRKDEYER